MVIAAVSWLQPPNLHLRPSHTCLARVRIPWLSCIYNICADIDDYIQVERGEDEGLDGVQNPAVEVSHPADAGQAVEAVADDEDVEKGSGDGEQNHGPEVVQEVAVVQRVG